MKRSQKVAVGVLASLTLGLAVAVAHAQPGEMGSGMGPDAMHSMQHGTKGSMGHSATGHGSAGQMPGQQLMTPEERTAIQEKIRNAKTPEERQKLAEATHAEMQQRAKDKGITLPEHRGPRAGFGPNFAPPFAAPTH